MTITSSYVRAGLDVIETHDYGDGRVSVSRYTAPDGYDCDARLALSREYLESQESLRIADNAEDAAIKAALARTAGYLEHVTDSQLSAMLGTDASGIKDALLAVIGDAA